MSPTLEAPSSLKKSSTENATVRRKFTSGSKTVNQTRTPKNEIPSIERCKSELSSLKYKENTINCSSEVGTSSTMRIEKDNTLSRVARSALLNSAKHNTGKTPEKDTRVRSRDINKLQKKFNKTFAFHNNMNTPIKEDAKQQVSVVTEEDSLARSLNQNINGEKILVEKGNSIVIEKNLNNGCELSCLTENTDYQFEDCTESQILLENAPVLPLNIATETAFHRAQTVEYSDTSEKISTMSHGSTISSPSLKTGKLNLNAYPPAVNGRTRVLDDKFSKIRCPSLQPNSNPSPKPSPFVKKWRKRIKKQEVQATNDTNASVHKLAQWLADDPFEKRKNLGVRKGSRILAKSRIFEPDQVSPKAARDFVDVSIDVSGKKDWLKGAFERKEVEDEEIKTTIIETNVEVTSKAKWLQEMAFKKKDEEPGSQLKQLVDTPGMHSFSEKSKWLQDAFKKAPHEEVIVGKTSKSSKAIHFDGKWQQEEATNKNNVCESDNVQLPKVVSSDLVSDKKEWLKNVFNNKAENHQKRMSVNISTLESASKNTVDFLKAKKTVQETGTSQNDVDEKFTKKPSNTSSSWKPQPGNVKRNTAIASFNRATDENKAKTSVQLRMEELERLRNRK